MKLKLYMIMLLAFGIAPYSLTALEKLGPDVTREKTTSSLDEMSLKPLYVYSERGRPDPFVAGSLLTMTAETRVFSISELVLVGFMAANNHKITLFRHKNGKTYTLRGDKLYGPENTLVNGVLGKILKERQVMLRQGEEKQIYNFFSGKDNR
jgi:hypothetical protein